MAKQVCKDCKFFKGLDEIHQELVAAHLQEKSEASLEGVAEIAIHSGNCFRYPPTQAEGQLYAISPLMTDDGWCGEFKGSSE